MAGNSDESRKPIKENSGLTKLSTEPTRGKTGTMATNIEDPHGAKPDDPGAPRLSPAMQGHLGRQLRAVYSQLVHEPMPDKLTKLLDELAHSQSKKAQKQERE